MRIFVLTGAGISAESGLGTFRDTSDASGGLWAKFDPMKLATPEAFAATPDKVHDFYNMRRANLLASVPNEAHAALAKLEHELEARGGELFLCTQNIDDLHERAGSRRVAHMHGELLKIRCTSCGAVHEWREDLGRSHACPTCGTTGTLRPHVVWFGEIPMGLDAIFEALESCDFFVAIGTSGSVYPAAGFVSQARSLGLRTCEINLEPSDNARIFDERHYGPASETVPAFVSRIITTL